MTTVIFVRHGQSEFNLARRFTGRTDVGLTELGRKQAESTAKELQKYHVTRIYSSPLKRALETAKPAAKLLGLEICPEPGLCEIDAGEWEGLPFETIEAKYPAEFAHLHGDRSLLQLPGGESMRQLYDRVTACVDRLVRENPGGCILLFSHALPLRSMICYWQGAPFANIGQFNSGSNASITVVVYDDDLTPRILRLSDNSHLEEITNLPLGL